MITVLESGEETFQMPVTNCRKGAFAPKLEDEFAPESVAGGRASDCFCSGAGAAWLAELPCPPFHHISVTKVATNARSTNTIRRPKRDLDFWVLGPLWSLAGAVSGPVISGSAV